MENFVSYYQIDEMSESDENDFEEDGMTMRSSPRVNQMQIFNRDVDSESLAIVSDEENDMKLNESLENKASARDNEEQCSKTRRGFSHSPPNEAEGGPTRRTVTYESSSLIRLQAMPQVSLSPQHSHQTM